ncbi:hypothetical protein [Burkholderia metallica]|uniref:hypothetical protein n=1 Tax=Burkholderia metallica TaxID=488729 RepID=UPI001CF26E3A|nr:hypothetical protein [Burkholderia metallica]MCA8018104.1 hypothetical protein [Burkholderia metallica]
MNNKTDAIATADICLSDADLPTYSELLAVARAAERKLRNATTIPGLRAKWRLDVRENELADLRSLIDRAA